MITELVLIDFKIIFDSENGEDYIKRIEDIPQKLLVDAASY
ncbi:MAG: hypothetical protein WD431_21455 [Cyclobacteriaceae bacterium]